MSGRLRFSLARAERHLRDVDPVVARLIDRHGRYRPRPAGDPYAALLRTIVFQQLAGAAAGTIFRRFTALYGDGEVAPTPSQLLATPDATLRQAGLSRQKIGYLRDLAHHVAAGDLDFARMHAWPDDDVIAHLTAVRGVGEWTAHIFLMFQLGRPDILPVGDLGLRRGMQVAYALPAPPSPVEAAAIGARWAPYRSVASWYMWRAVEGGVPGPPAPPGPRRRGASAP